MATTPHGRAGTVAAGRFIVEVGNDTGLALAPRPAAEEDDGAVRAALAGAERAPAPAPRLEGALDSAAEATARCEEAADLVEAVLSGGILDRERALARADVMLELLQRLDRGGRFEDALKLARMLVKLLTLLRRWADLARTLHAGLRAARAVGDAAAEALFSHDLGTLELVGGRLAEADDRLEAARELRRRLGDRRGLAATERTLELLCRRLRRRLHEADGGTSRWRRVTLALTVLVLGLLAGLVVALAREDPPSTRAGTPTPTPTVTPTPTAGPGEVVVDVATEGDGRVTGPELDCGDDCRARRPAGTRMTLTATPADGAQLRGWQGDCAGTARTCTLELSRDMAATAVFADAGPGTAVITASVSGEGATLSGCAPSCEAAIGSTVVIEATVDEGHAIGSWTGCTRSAATRCEVDVTGDAEVVAQVAVVTPEPPDVD